MNNIRVLDCTLRDGGYINDWNFGHQNIKNILEKLTKANIDIVECGFLEDGEYNSELTLFTDVAQIEALLPEDKGKTQYVAMTRFGHLEINNLKEYDGRSIDGIRITFHEDEVEEAIEFCKLVQAKGYKVYVQPVGTTSYSDNYLLELIKLVNSIMPYAFYIVDTLGLMRKNDLLRMFYLVDNNLHRDIVIGYHSHNNLQLAFSNAQELAEIHTKRSIIMDSSVYGMGRGAGNLNTELITQHLNSLKDKTYNTDYLLEIIDETIEEIKQKYTWGYSVPYYLAAINNCHPNYATYLINRKTLPVKSISNILQIITQDKRELYNEQYIQELYTQYQKNNIDDTAALQELKSLFAERPILVVAPGSSVRKEIKYIKKYINEHHPIIITVNYDGDGLLPDYCFFSNKKRYQRFVENNDMDRRMKLILSSNIRDDRRGNNSYIVNYSDLLNSQPLVNDNATLMLLALIIKLDVKEVAIAGFDGFQFDSDSNYADDGLETSLEKDVIIEVNRQISNVVNIYSQTIRLNFITKSLYQLNYVTAAMVSRE